MSHYVEKSTILLLYSKKGLLSYVPHAEKIYYPPPLLQKVIAVICPTVLKKSTILLLCSKK
jgi:hypothetical protein